MHNIYLILFVFSSQISMGQVDIMNFKANKETRRLGKVLNLDKSQKKLVFNILEDYSDKIESIVPSTMGLTKANQNLVTDEFLKKISLYFGMSYSIQKILDDEQKIKYKNLIIPKDVFLENFLVSPKGKALRKEEKSDLLIAWKHL